MSATGSAGTIGAGDYLKSRIPGVRIVAVEALQCPTLFMNGFGDHRIEGIGDKHVPWIHNSKNTDVVVAIDDNAVVNLARLFNEENGRAYLVSKGVPENIVSQLDLMGFSGISNVLSAIKTAKYYEMDSNDIMVTVLTDSMDLYRSRLHEMHQEFGEYSERDAAELVQLLDGLKCSVNLILGNPTSSGCFRPSTDEDALAFKKKLIASGIRTMMRVSRGVDIEAGCGQLRSRRLANAS